MKLYHSIILPMIFAGTALGTSIVESLSKQGYIELANTSCLKKDYTRLYSYFETFIHTLSSNVQAYKAITSSEDLFLSNQSLKKRYCSAPPSYRNPKQNFTKRHNKIYFQFISKHYELIKNSSLVREIDALSDFFTAISCVDKMAKKTFSALLNELEQDIPGITKTFYGAYTELTVITKIIRYDQTTDKWGTIAHCDKSGFTLIWNSTDDTSLVICSDLKNPSIQSLESPKRIFSHNKDMTSTILLNGAALLPNGINLYPTVHGVIPLKNQYRYAVISFLLIPDISMDKIQTDFE